MSRPLGYNKCLQWISRSTNWVEKDGLPAAITQLLSVIYDKTEEQITRNVLKDEDKDYST